ncbi:hypothetical protein AOLI_G00314510 [Acnodon oligacanthus]
MERVGNTDGGLWLVGCLPELANAPALERPGSEQMPVWENLARHTCAGSVFVQHATALPSTHTDPKRCNPARSLPHARSECCSAHTHRHTVPLHVARLFMRRQSVYINRMKRTNTIRHTASSFPAPHQGQSRLPRPLRSRCGAAAALQSGKRPHKHHQCLRILQRWEAFRGETEEAYQVKPKTWQEWWDVIGVGGEGSYIRSQQLEGHASALPPRAKNPFHFLLLCFRHSRALFSQVMGLSDSESEGFVLSESLGRIPLISLALTKANL